MRADSIAGKGRIGQAGAMGIASAGRLANIGEIIITVIRTEIIRLKSAITRVVHLESGI